VASGLKQSRSGPGIDVFTLVFEDQPIAHPDNAIGRCRDARVMRHEHNGEPIFDVDLAEEVQNLASCPGVKIAGRLVGDQKRASVDKCPRDRDTLLLTAGKLRWLVIEPIAQPDSLEKRARPGTYFTIGIVVCAIQARHHYVFERRHTRQEIEILEDETDLSAPQRRSLRFAELRDVPTVKAVHAARGAIEVAQEIDQSRLAGT
jgi:hypothetical protein